MEKGGLFGAGLKRGDENSDKNANKNREQKRQKNDERPAENDHDNEAGKTGNTSMQGKQQMLGGGLSDSVSVFSRERSVFDRLV